MNSQLFLNALVTELEPQSIIYAGDLAEKAVVDYLAKKTQKEHVPAEKITLTDIDLISVDQQFQLAIISQGFDGKNIEEETVMLGKMRNFFARQIILFIDNQSNWTVKKLIAMGFKREQIFSSEQLVCYSYDIKTYNKKREWNNSKNWANPEMWNKARW